MIKYLPLDVMVSFLFKGEGPEDYYEVWMCWLEEGSQIGLCYAKGPPHSIWNLSAQTGF